MSVVAGVKLWRLRETVRFARASDAFVDCMYDGCLRLDMRLDKDGRVRILTELLLLRGDEVEVL